MAIALRECAGLPGLHRGLILILLVIGARNGPARADERAGGQPQSQWSLRPIGSPLPPVTQSRSWVRTPIDAFILKKLEEQRLEPAPAADLLTWLRRASFDLRGLPPSPEEIEHYLADGRPDADARLVDRLLAPKQA